MAEEHLSAQPIDPADARARIVEAIGKWDMTVPPVETDSWPACSPMIEWLVRKLPAGGTGYMRPEWSQEDRDRLLDQFMGSPFAEVRGLTRDQVRGLVESLVWFGCDYGPGDPLRWSPVSVEIVLTDWYPRKVFGVPDAEVRKLPDVLAGFIRCSHRHREIPAELTDETLEAVRRWEDEFVHEVHKPGRSPGSNAARLARFAAGLDPEAFDDYDEDFDEDLDDEPLGDVPFDWPRVLHSTQRREAMRTKRIVAEWRSRHD